MFPRLLRTLLLLTYSLWFGGIITLFISVITLFHTDRAIAFQAAPLLFGVFEKYQIILSLIAMLLCASDFALTRRRILLPILGLFWAAAICCFVNILVITPTIIRLRNQGLSGSEEFKSAHGHSMIVYTAEVACLLLIGLILPAIFRTTPTTSPATNSPP